MAIQNVSLEELSKAPHNMSARASVRASVNRAKVSLINVQVMKELGKTLEFTHKGTRFVIPVLSAMDGAELEEIEKRIKEISKHRQEYTSEDIKKAYQDATAFFASHSYPKHRLQRLAWYLRGKPNMFAKATYEEIGAYLLSFCIALIQSNARSLLSSH